MRPKIYNKTFEKLASEEREIILNFIWTGAEGSSGFEIPCMISYLIIYIKFIHFDWLRAEPYSLCNFVIPNCNRNDVITYTNFWITIWPSPCIFPMLDCSMHTVCSSVSVGLEPGIKPHRLPRSSSWEKAARLCYAIIPWKRVVF